MFNNDNGVKNPKIFSITTKGVHYVIIVHVTELVTGKCRYSKNMIRKKRTEISVFFIMNEFNRKLNKKKQIIFTMKSIYRYRQNIGQTCETIP